MYWPIFTLVSILFLALLWGVGIWILHKQHCVSMNRLFEHQESRIQMLTNLAASKELTAFTSLQSLVPNQQTLISNIDPVFMPKDDQTMARLLASRYESQGLDPSLAYSNELNPLEEFGLGNGGTLI